MVVTRMTRLRFALQRQPSLVIWQHSCCRLEDNTQYSLPIYGYDESRPPWHPMMLSPLITSLVTGMRWSLLSPIKDRDMGLTQEIGLSCVMNPLYKHRLEADIITARVRLSELTPSLPCSHGET
jgi:hypothetical protein